MSQINKDVVAMYQCYFEAKEKMKKAMEDADKTLKRLMVLASAAGKGEREPINIDKDFTHLDSSGNPGR